MMYIPVKVTICLVLVTGLISADRVIHAPWGQIEGIKNVTDDLTPFYAFLGIPYAVPPVGDLRFAKPVPHPGVNGTFYATAFGPSCMQSLLIFTKNSSEGNEDCLTLNVFTPASHADSSKMAVMIWIHGGGYILGNAAVFDASPIVALGNVIVVTIQYRLGPFGFLSTGDDNSKGNYGLWDQHLAIKWVKENIEAFGGDPNRITLIGESAGSSSVAFQALYPHSRGLFHRIIMQSGSATSSWAIKRNPLPEMYEIADRLNCLPSGQHYNHRDILSCLRMVPADKLVMKSWPMRTNFATALMDFYFVPTVDGEFIQDDPHKLIASPAYLSQAGIQDLDCMLGVNSNEGGNILLLAVMTDQIFNTSLSQEVKTSHFYTNTFVPLLLQQYFGDFSADMVDVLRFEYIFPNSISERSIDIQIVYDTEGDPAIVVPTIQFALAHSKITHTKNTFLYHFDHRPSFLPPSFPKGLVHGYDIPYTFGLSTAVQKVNNIQNISTSEVELAKTVMAIITDFAKVGDPNAALGGRMTPRWPQYNSSTQQYLTLSFNKRVNSHLYQRRVSLWTQLLPKLLNNWQTRKLHANTGPTHTTVDPKFGLPVELIG